MSASPERARSLIALLADCGFSPEALLQPRRRDVLTLAEGDEAAERYVDAVVDSHHRGGRPPHHHWPPFDNLLFHHADGSGFLLDTDMDAELLFVWAWGPSAPSAASTLLEAIAVELGEE